MVPKAQNVNPSAGEVLRSCGVMSACWFRTMLLTVKFNGEIRGSAIEIENIGSDRMLTPE